MVSLIHSVIAMAGFQAVFGTDCFHNRQLSEAFPDRHSRWRKLFPLSPMYAAHGRALYCGQSLRTPLIQFVVSVCELKTPSIKVGYRRWHD